MINLINEPNDINNLDLSKLKNKYLIKKREDVVIKHVDNLNTFIECWSTMDDVYENIHDNNPSRKKKILIAFDDMIADVMTSKNFKP